MSNERKNFIFFILLVLIISIGVFCTPVSALYIWDVNDPALCPLDAEIGESIITSGDPPSQKNVIVDSYNATDEQKQLVSEIRGSEITMGEFLRIVYPHIWNGLSPEGQKLYESYMKAWGAVDPIPLPPWHEPGEAPPSGDDTPQLNLEEGLGNSGYPLVPDTTYLSHFRLTRSFRQYDLTQLESMFGTADDSGARNRGGFIDAQFSQSPPRKVAYNRYQESNAIRRL